jgi:hypothetical protein
MAKYAGRKGVVYMSSSGSGTASSVVGMSKWSIDMSTDKIEVTAFGDTNKTYVQALRDLQGAFEGLYDDTETKIFAGAQSSDGVKLYLYPSSDAATKYAYGTAWLDASMDVDISGAVKISAKFAAASSWGINF